MNDELRAALIAYYEQDDCVYGPPESGDDYDCGDSNCLFHQAHHALAIPSPEATADGEDVRQLREALEFYADLLNWKPIVSDEHNASPPEALKDRGEIARVAMSAAPESVPEEAYFEVPQPLPQIVRGIVVSVADPPTLAVNFGEESAPAEWDAEERVRDWRPASHAIHETLLETKWTAYSSDDFTFLTLALCGEVGELANVVKKVWRGDWGPIGDLWAEPGVVDVPDDLRWKLTEELADVRIYLESVARCVGIDLDEAVDTIIRDKLLPRWPQCRAAVEALDVTRPGQGE